MTTAHTKHIYSAILCILVLVCNSCGSGKPSYALTKEFLGYGVSLEKASKSYTVSSDGFNYAMEVWSLPAYYTKKINKNFLKISQTRPSYTESEAFSIRWTALPIEDTDTRYYTESMMRDNKGITEIQEIEILLKAVLREKGNFYTYTVSDAQDPEKSGFLRFSVYCSERKLLIVIKRTKEV